ncbi:hypothetical protein D3C73_1203620 [compost metagenome]
MGLLTAVPAEEQAIGDHAARHQPGRRCQEPATAERWAGRHGQGVEHGLQAVHRCLASHLVIGGLERQAAAGQPLQAQAEHRVLGNGRVDVGALIGVELVVQVGHQLLIRGYRVHRRSPVEGLGTVCSGGYSASFARAVASRLITVPMGTCRTSATSR